MDENKGAVEKVLLSEQPHVEIKQWEWPALVSYADPQWKLYVRQRQGKSTRLVYGTWIVPKWPNNLVYAGFLIEEKDDMDLAVSTLRAVRRVAGRIGLPSETTDALIAKLPAVLL
jgi:hypothetical protein